MPVSVIQETNLSGLKLFKRGKVRDLYDLGENLLIVATDRISAFDCILPNGIPDKGRILTGLSEFWFNHMSDIVSSHLITSDLSSMPAEVQRHADILEGRTMLVKKSQPIEVECVVRGYLAGSAWRDYQKKRLVCDIRLPPDLRESERIPEPIFSPATKAASGHDINITAEDVEELVGQEVADILIMTSLSIYSKASDYALSRGLILSDTKFEFGMCDGETIIIDELLTPDSSRFWLADDYEVGKSQDSLDKQYVRDYLETLNWDKSPPAPELPEDVISKTREKYLLAYRKITGQELI